MRKLRDLGLGALVGAFVAICPSSGFAGEGKVYPGLYERAAKIMDDASWAKYQPSLEYIVGTELEAFNNVLDWVSKNRKLTLVRDKTTYLVCDEKGFQFLVGYKQGHCLAISVNPDRYVEYLPLTMARVKVGYGTDVDNERPASAPTGTRIIEGGDATLYDLAGFYYGLSSGVGVYKAAGDSNWIYKKYGSSAEVQFDWSVDYTTVRLDILSANFVYLFVDETIAVRGFQIRSIPGN